MEENNTTSQNENENDESKKEKNVKTKKPKQEAKSERDGFKDYKAEFDRIIWLKKDELAKKNRYSYYYILACRSHNFLYGRNLFRSIQFSIEPYWLKSVKRMIICLKNR